MFLEQPEMLDQKRRAWLRGISLNYRVNGRPMRVLSNEERTELDKRRVDASREAENARREAENYTGGLLQGLALAKEQTALLTVAMIDLQAITARWGMAVPAVPAAQSPSTPIGRNTDDKGAL